MPWPKKINNDQDKLFLKEGEMVKFIILDKEPELYYVHFDVNMKTVSCTAPDCQKCQAGLKRSEKGTIGVLDISDGKKKKLCGTSALFRSIKETLDMVDGQIENFIFSVKAVGIKNQRRYHIVPNPIARDLERTDKREGDVSNDGLNAPY